MSRNLCADCEVPDEICDLYHDCVADVWHASAEIYCSKRIVGCGIYSLQGTPDVEALLENGSKVIPLATLKSEYGGVSHIIKDDHCYVLINRIGLEGPFRMSYHWFNEAVDALKHLI